MPYKLSIWIFVFLLSFNSGAIALEQTGAADYMGISPDLGDTSELDSAASTQEFQTGTGSGSTLFGTYNRMASTLNGFLNAIMPGAEMLKNAWPNPTFHLLVNMVFTVLSVIPVIDLILFVRRG